MVRRIPRTVRARFMYLGGTDNVVKGCIVLPHFRAHKNVRHEELTQHIEAAAWANTITRKL